VPATGDYWNTPGPSRPSGPGTEGTSPSRPGAPAGQTGPAAELPAGSSPAGAGPGSYPGAGPGSYPGAGPGSFPGAGSGSATQPPPAGRRRPVALAAGLGGGLVVVVVAALFAGAHFFGPGSTPRVAAPNAAQPGLGSSAPGAGTGAVPAVFGVPTVTGGCPAASAGTSGARCPSRPECWNGIVEIAGDTTAPSLPCTGPHVWETFAIGILPAAASTFDEAIVAKDPTARAVCSVSVLLRSRAGAAQKIPAASWEIQVVPPDEAAYDSGARAYRCLAHVLTGPDPATSQFLR
jgi:hypothetical protein